MWQMSLPWWEFVLRGIIIYVFLTVLLRLTGSRQMGHIGSLDMILLLVLSNTVQNAMNGGDNSIPGGLICAITVVGVNYFVAWLTFRFQWLGRLIEGRAIVLIRDGKIVEHERRRAMITREEIMAALRENDCKGLEDVRYATLENTGEITIVTRNHPAAA